jgi:hypothetical protein
MMEGEMLYPEGCASWIYGINSIEIEDEVLRELCSLSLESSS